MSVRGHVRKVVTVEEVLALNWSPFAVVALFSSSSQVVEGLPLSLGPQEVREFLQPWLPVGLSPSKVFVVAEEVVVLHLSSVFLYQLFLADLGLFVHVRYFPSVGQLPQFD